MHCLSVMPRAGCILPLRILTVVRQVLARLVVAPYGGNWQCSQLFVKFLFDGRNNPNPCRRHTAVFRAHTWVRPYDLLFAKFPYIFLISKKISPYFGIYNHRNVLRRRRWGSDR